MRRREKGFSLIEVLIAIVILAGSIVTVSLSWSGNLMRLRKSKLKTEVAFLLERKVSEVLMQYEGGSLDEIPEEESGDFGKGFSKYSWEMTSKEFEMPDMKAATIAKMGDSNSELLGIMMEQMQEFFSKSIKEVTVSIIADVNKKELRYSVTTYVVDYNQDISLAGGGGDDEE